MMQRFLVPARDTWSTLTARPTASFESLEPLVKTIFNEVKTAGDVALQAFTQKFDQVTITHLRAKDEEYDAAIDALSDALKDAIDLAYTNIETFHAAQKSKPISVDTQKGVRCWQEKRPIEKVGLYIPGGTAPLFSSLLMLAIPAQLAGCKEIVLCTPPNKEGKIASEILYVAQRCGIKKIFKVGGAQAIAALTFGTESIPKVDKIFGPGNQYVTVAKQMATQHHVAIDMPAGPSELLVVADTSCNPAFVAADLLSQAEHGIDSQVILVSNSTVVLDAVEKEIAQQLPLLPRKAIAEQALKNSKAVFFDQATEAQEFINAYGPEHYIICVENPVAYTGSINNAGSVFVGNYTPESAGDYASGTNHTLPTNGYARQYSGVNLDSFLKAITFQEISAEGLEILGPAIELMAAAEGLEAHKNAVTLRLNDLKN